VRIRGITFEGELSLKEQMVPLMGVNEYRGEDGPIAESALFQPQELGGFGQLALEMHRIADTGETHVILRKIGN
jgi:hypothetical protein